jgi:hypothetical protein
VHIVAVSGGLAMLNGVSAKCKRFAGRITGRAQQAVTLRRLIALVYPSAKEASSELGFHLEPEVTNNWHVVLRSANNTPVQAERPTRKYLWVRRTSRRAYNIHMSRMHESLAEIKSMPTLVLFGSIIGIALVLSILIR